jgi:hypothetical protein
MRLNPADFKSNENRRAVGKRPCSPILFRNRLVSIEFEAARPWRRDNLNLDAGGTRPGPIR